MTNLRILQSISLVKGLYFFVPVFAFFVLGNGISLSSLVFAQTLYSLATFLAEVPTGMFADRFGQKASIVAGYFAEAFGLLLLLIFPTTLGLYVSFVFRGIAGACLSGSEEALLYESARQEGRSDFQKIYGRFLSNEQIGFAAAIALGGVAYDLGGPAAAAWLMVVTALCLLAAGTLALFLWVPRVATAAPEAGSGMFAVLRQSARLVTKNTAVLTLTVVGALTIANEYFAQDVIQPYFAERGVSASFIGFSLAAGALLNILGTRYVYLLEERLSVERALAVLNLALGAAYVVLAFAVHPALLVGVFVAMGGLFNLQAPIISDYINARTGSSVRTTVLSGVSAFRRLVQLVLVWALSIVVARYGVATSLAVQGVYLLVGMAIGYWLLVRCGCTHRVANPEGERLVP